jgi:hypothetical protein
MIQADVFKALSENAGVIALAGSRIFPVRLPRDAQLPALVYQIPSIEPIVSISGDSGVDMGSLIVNCWADSYGKAHELAEAARTALKTAGLKITTESQNDGEDLDTQNYSVALNFKIWSE